MEPCCSLPHWLPVSQDKQGLLPLSADVGQESAVTAPVCVSRATVNPQVKECGDKQQGCRNTVYSAVPQGNILATLQAGSPAQRALHLWV